MGTENELLDSIDSFLDEILKNNLLARINCNYQPSKLNTIAHKLNKIADVILLNTNQGTFVNNEFCDLLEETIVSFGNHDFSRRIEYTTDGSIMDAIAAGINMLGDEMSKTLVSRDFFKNIFDSVKDILIVFDASGEIIDINASGMEVFNVLPSENRKSKFQISNDLNFTKILGVINDLKYKEEYTQRGELQFNLKDNKIVFIDYTVVMINDRNADTGRYLFSGHDVTIRKLKEQSEVNLLIQVQEAERKRLSEDLHDSLAQRLNGIALHLNSLKSIKTDAKEFDICYNICIQSVKESLTEIRELSFNLMPNSIDQGGLYAGIEELIQRVRLKIDFTKPKIEPVLKPDQKINIYRIIQEFISNSIKHSSTSKILIKIKLTKGILSVSLQDFGIGFDYNSEFNGSGLKNIKSRMTALNADWKYSGKLGKGVSLEFKLNVS